MGVAGRRPGRWRLGISAAAGGIALSADAVFSLRNVEKSFSAAGTSFRLLVAQLRIKRGATLALTGESGSGKSTLLEMLAMVLKPDRGDEFTFAPQAQEPGRRPGKTPESGSEPGAGSGPGPGPGPGPGQAWSVLQLWAKRDADRLATLRSRYLGYVLQHGGLLPYLSVRANIELPRQLLGLPGDDSADRLADRLGIAQQLSKRPAELSVGQRQRAGIARALAHDPPVVIADEPTAAIDPVNAQRIVNLLAELATELGVTLIVATHAHDLVKNAGFRILRHDTELTGPNAMTSRVTDG